MILLPWKPQIVSNKFPETNIFFTTFFISIKNGFYIIFAVAMVTKFKKLSWLYDFIFMETPVVLNDFPKLLLLLPPSLLV